MPSRSARSGPDQCGRPCGPCCPTCLSPPPSNDVWSGVVARLSVAADESDAVLLDEVEPSVGHRRRGPWLVAAAVLLVGAMVGVVLVRREAGPTASGDGRPHFVLDEPPAGMVLAGASERAVPVDDGSWSLALRSVAAPTTWITVGCPQRVEEGVERQQVAVRGGTGAFVSDPSTTLSWKEGAVPCRIDVSGARAADLGFAQDVAARLRFDAGADAAHPALGIDAPPAGFVETFRGLSAELLPTEFSVMSFLPPSPSPGGPSLIVAVERGGADAAVLTRMYGLEPVRVRGAVAATGSDGAAAVGLGSPDRRMVVLDLGDGSVLVAIGVGISGEDLLATVERLRPVSVADGHAAMGSHLQPAVSSPDATGSSVAELPTTIAGG